jgi:hypothetical protein
MIGSGVEVSASDNLVSGGSGPYHPAPLATHGKRYGSGC